MTEKELIGKIRELRQIKPRKEWVFLTKAQILGAVDVKHQQQFRWLSWLEVFPRIVFQYRLAFASLTLIVILVGALSFAQNALPGDLLFNLKKITEKVGAIFVSRQEQPRAQLELTNKRLEELTKIAEENQVKKLAPAIEESQASLSQAVKITSQLKEPQEVKKIVTEIKKIEENIQNLKSYGVEIGEAGETENLYKPIVEVLIKDLENGTLTEDQQKLLNEAKNYFELGNYSEALTKIWILSQNK